MDELSHKDHALYNYFMQKEILKLVRLNALFIIRSR